MTNSTKFYAVECTAGRYGYEDYDHWIAGIFLNADDAEKKAFEIIAKVEVVKNDPAPDEDSLEYRLAIAFDSARVVEYPK